MNVTKFEVFTKILTRWPLPPRDCASEINGVAAKSWRWLDDTTAEFTLKQGIKYQNKPPANGREAVAQDFVASFKRFQSNLAYMEGMSRRVVSVTATDKYTFQMKLETPWGGLFNELLAHYYGPWLEPVEITSKDYDWSDPAKAWVGSGPFMLEKWMPGVKWTLVRNPDYFVKGKPYIDQLDMLIIPEAATKLAALRSGQLSLILGLSEELIDEARRSIPGLQVVRCPGGIISGAGNLFMHNGAPPFNDVRVRRAVAMAIDKEAIVKTLYKGRAAIYPVYYSAAPYAMKIEDFPPEVRQYLEYHPDRSRKLLAEAGYPNGFDTVINFTVRYAAPAVMVAEAIAGMLNEVGIRAKLNLMEYGRYAATVVKANYPEGEMAMSPASVLTPEAAHALGSPWSKSGTVNRSIVRDPEYDALYERFAASTDEAERAELARQLQIMMVSKAYKVLLPITDSVMVGLPGIHFNWMGGSRELGPLFENIWIE